LRNRGRRGFIPQELPVLRTSFDGTEVVCSIRTILYIIGTSTFLKLQQNPTVVIEKQSDLTPRDDVKKSVSEILKRVDMLLKQGDLKTAMLETKRAKEVDPRNVYALAFEERIVALLEQSEKKKLEADEAAPQREAQNAQRKKEDEARLKAEELRKKKEQEEQATRMREHARLEAQRQMAAQQASPPATSTPPAAVSLAHAQQPPAAPVATPLPPRPQQAATQSFGSPHTTSSEISLLASLKKQLESYNSYKAALIEVWADGAASTEEQQWLKVLRETLNISSGDHSRLEHEVQLEAYQEALKRAWSHGRVNQENAQILSDLRRTFHISHDDHDKIEARLLSEMQALAKKQARIAVIDDDGKLLDLICETLQDAGFSTLPFRTSDEAYAYLRTNPTPDLILCDINLETSTMGGFSFFEKIQWLEHVQEAPFIFLTGLTDEVLVRTGKELGVDDYLTKPISDQTLIATIKGKLKRFSRLKGLK